MMPSSSGGPNSQQQGSLLISPNQQQHQTPQNRTPTLPQIDLDTLSTKELELLLTDEDAFYELKVKWLKRTQVCGRRASYVEWLSYHI
jgi:hypothetical protein